MPAKRSSAATRVSAAEAYAWGHLPGESLLWLAGQTLLASVPSLKSLALMVLLVGG